MYIPVYTYMDKRRSCEARPFRVQANLTRSWCNGVALCRTSSLQQAFKSCRWLVGRTRNTTAEGPSELSWGNKSVRRNQPAADRSGTHRSSPQKPEVLFFSFFFFTPPPNCSFSFYCRSAEQQSTLQRAEHPNCFSRSDLTQLNHHTGEVALGCLCALERSLHWVSLPAHAAN